MDRDTLQDDLDLILGPSRDADLPGEWDWEPPLGTVAPAPAPASAAEPEETEETEETDAEATDDPMDEDEDD